MRNNIIEKAKKRVKYIETTPREKIENEIKEALKQRDALLAKGEHIPEDGEGAKILKELGKLIYQKNIDLRRMPIKDKHKKKS